MELHQNNYFSLEADKYYMSVSQYKSFLSCEAKAMAKLNGKYEEPKSDAFILGSYVHAWNEGTLDQFKEEHPELFSSRGPTKGQLLKSYELGNKMIEVLANDKLITLMREGQKEIVMTGELFGVMWKIMIDIYNLPRKIFVDLKTTREIHKQYWNDEYKEHENFIQHYDYLSQMAVYAEIERQNRKGTNYLEPHIIAVSKEPMPDKAVINLGTAFIENKLLEIELNMDRIRKVKYEGEAPQRCEKCDYCKSTKQLKEIIYYKDL